MTMSCLMVHWFERLAAKGVIRPGSSMLEFGPQDFDTPDEVVVNVAQRLFPAGEANRQATRALDALRYRRSRYHPDFYSLFGVTSYKSLDPFDPHADYHYDLNYFVPLFGSYDIVTNFGTSEHVFETARVYRTAHRLLRRDGLLLIVLPTYGDIDHGFFNVHPVLYRTMAQHSGYELCDLQYIDDIAIRTRRQCEQPSAPFDFDGLPIQLADMADERGFKRKVMSRFVENGRKRTGDAGEMPDVFDYCFVALRKTRGGAMRRPYQYSSAPPPSWANLWAFASVQPVRSKLVRAAQSGLRQMYEKLPVRAKNLVRRFAGR